MTTTNEIGTVETENALELESASREEMEAQVNAVDPGQLPQTEEDRTLYRVLRFRAHLASERERVAEAMATMLDQMEKRIAGLDYFYAPLLQDIVGRKLIGQKAKSIKTPFGVAGFRTINAKIEVKDEAKLPDAFKREIPASRVVDRAKIAEAFKGTGEIPEGCEIVPAMEKFYIK